MTWKLRNRIKSLLLIFMTVTKPNGKLEGIQRRVKLLRCLGSTYLITFRRQQLTNMGVTSVTQPST